MGISPVPRFLRERARATTCVDHRAFGGDQSGWIPADLMTPDQSSVCDLMKAVNWSDVPGVTTTPSSASLFAIAGFDSALLVSALSCRTMSAGVFAGATRPHQTDAS